MFILINYDMMINWKDLIVMNAIPINHFVCLNARSFVHCLNVMIEPSDYPRKCSLGCY